MPEAVSAWQGGCQHKIRHEVRQRGNTLRFRPATCSWESIGHDQFLVMRGWGRERRPPAVCFQCVQLLGEFWVQMHECIGLVETF